MQEHNWLLSVVSDLKAYSEDKNVPGLISGLQHVLATYAEEASLSDDEKKRLLNKLNNSNEKVA